LKLTKPKRAKQKLKNKLIFAPHDTEEDQHTKQKSTL
jgi:hypothetical protein